MSSLNQSGVVYFNDIPAGKLQKLQSGYEFEYFQEYLLNPALPQISLSLPKRPEKFVSPFLFPVFFGMLSEGSNKQIICKKLKIAEDDYFGLLLASAGNETIGALTVRNA